MRSPWVIAIAAVGAAACGPSMSDQKPPLYSIGSGNGLCSSTTIVDRSGIAASESGCEERSSGWKVSRLTDSQRRRFFEAVAALPPPGRYGDCDDPNAHDSVSFSVSEPGKQTVTWVFCGGRDQEGLRRIQEALGSQ